MFGSSRISYSSKLSCMLSLPASMKRIRSRTAEKKWRHHFSHYKPMGIFSDFQGQQSAVGGPIKPKFELVRALMHVIIACKYEKDQMKNSREKVETPFSHHYPICYHGNQWLDLAEFQTHPSYHVYYHYLQIQKGSNQEQPGKSGDIVFPIISLSGFF